jgi:alkylated DNA repair dioxygenase AlkB
MITFIEDEDDYEKTTIKLPHGNSSISFINEIPKNIQISKTEFEALWNSHPEEYGSGIIFGKEIAFPRWTQSFGKTYKFTGTDHKSVPIDNEFLKKLLKWVNEDSGCEYNQILINWYKDGNHYIGAHSDSTAQLVPNSSIYSFSFGAKRDFIIESKDKKYKERVVVEHNSLLIMEGEMQKWYKHSVPKQPKIKDKRINITFRLFRE